MTAWLMIGALAVTTALIKAFGPVLVGGRELPPTAVKVIALLPPVLLAALVVTSTLSEGQRLHVDASAAGVAVAGVMIWRRLPLLVVVLTAVVVTAGVRALT
ncbi:AzlD domain-containing protein [Nocardioides abyssi]|uniref:AzlD domain-containing protein n=1 Tax=Nocardioides abyssi TaxID=3058370 RepID=A0ABT8ERW5_9ACTN|nr:AzlD domain-containing protein [Nocardioides abyssi]MDN4160880.1 AzlD domain-containing protein [Nocardioides abyssi]